MDQLIFFRKKQLEHTYVNSQDCHMISRVKHKCISEKSDGERQRTHRPSKTNSEQIIPQEISILTHELQEAKVPLQQTYNNIQYRPVVNSITEL